MRRARHDMLVIALLCFACALLLTVTSGCGSVGDLIDHEQRAARNKRGARNQPKPRPVSVLDCQPVDRCDGDPRIVAPLPDPDVQMALDEVRDWFKQRVESGELKTKRQHPNWDRRPRIEWVPTFFMAGIDPAAGVANNERIKISTIQSWRRRGLVRHETCHWWYCYLIGNCDQEHAQQYLN